MTNRTHRLDPMTTWTIVCLAGACISGLSVTLIPLLRDSSPMPAIERPASVYPIDPVLLYPVEWQEL